MRNYVVITAFTLLLAGIYACQSPNTSQGSEARDTTTIADVQHNSQNALDWAGTYTGTLPCADCEGIETRLTLNNDKTYLLQTTYLGKNDKPFEQQGTFDWNSSGNTITLSDTKDAPGQYMVGENTLTQLDMDGNKISGDLAQKYILMKSNPKDNMALDSITDTRWILTELMGQPVDSMINGKAPFLLLTTEENRVQANGGCNTIAGSYDIKEGNRISFSQMIATRMACPDMEVENQLLKVLETADNYSLNGQQLTLNKARMAPLARFEAAPSE